MGRPKKGDAWQKFEFHATFNYQDSADLREICRKEGITKTEFFRRCIHNEMFRLKRLDEYDYEEVYEEEV